MTSSFSRTKRSTRSISRRKIFRRSIGKLKDTGVIDEKIRNFLEDPTTLKDRIASPRKWTPLESGKDKQVLDVVFFVGPSLEAWNPETARKDGIGGSETAVIEVSRRLAAFGHRVRVYGDCVQRGGGSIEGTFDGVTYLHHDKARGEACDVLIASRRPEAVDVLGMRFDRAWLWVHDIHCGGALTPERAEKFDKILVLSDWHRTFMIQTYPFLRGMGEKIEKTRNGIDLGRFEASVQRNAHRAIYSSSPDRGLQCALDIWPEVRKRVPDAELHIYYGFENWEKCASGEAWAIIANLKKAIEDRKGDGVVFHGRTPQDVLAKEMLGSGVWCYPTWFHETSCITAMESQAAGLRMVSSPIAALSETVGARGTLVPGIHASEDYKVRFVDAVVEAMTAPGDEDRKKLQAYAHEHFGWNSLATEWDAMLRPVTHTIIPLVEASSPVTGIARVEHVEIPQAQKGQIVHAVLTEYATGGVVMNPHELEKTEITGGGCRPAFLLLVKELAKYGHTVRAFSTFTEAATVGGVEYLPLSQLEQRGRPNVMWAYYDTRVLTGRAGMFRVASHHTYHLYDTHLFYVDVNTVPSQATLDVLKPFWAPWSDWVVLPNAVDDVPSWDPIPGRVVYHTSPDRGLHHLLRAWPEIKRRVPHASLHVIGRGEKWSRETARVFGMENSEWGRRARAVGEAFEQARRAGDVVSMTDLPRPLLMEQLRCASVFAFPCSTIAPCETFSVSVMECCKIGVPVVLSPVDALESIYKDHVVMTRSPVEEHLPEFIDAVVSVLEDRQKAEHFSKLGRKLAAGYTYERTGIVLNEIVSGRLPAKRT